jgi:hypothetical protein
MNSNTLSKKGKQVTDYDKENIIVREELLEDLHEGIVKVTFTKKDGTERVMNCTLVPSYLPEAYRTDVRDDEDKKVNENVLAVWDTDADGWRSFRLDSVKIAYLVGADVEVEGHPV